MWRQKSDFFKNGFAFFALYSNLYHTHAEGGTSKMGACKLNCKFIRSKNSKGGNFVDKFLLHFLHNRPNFFFAKCLNIGRPLYISCLYILYL